MARKSDQKSPLEKDAEKAAVTTEDDPDNGEREPREEAADMIAGASRSSRYWSPR
jgi:hypothetical protein